MRDDKSMTRLVMYPLETRLDAFHCRYDDDSCTCCSWRATALCLNQWRRLYLIDGLKERTVYMKLLYLIT